VRTFFLIIIGAIFALNAIWWVVCSRLTRHTRWRYVMALFMVFQLTGMVWLIAGRLSHNGWDRLLPKYVVSALLIWHMMVLPIALGGLAVTLLIAMAIWGSAFLGRRRRAAPAQQPPRISSSWSRREFLGFAAAAAPPLLTFSLTTVAMRQLSDFRVRRLVLPIVNLPTDLHGMTIAQVSDIHVGRFTSGHVLREVVDMTNQLRSDLVLLTGDLINDALADLDHGLELVREMEARFGVYLIEGNHDLIEDGPEFERRVKASGIPFLLDESTVVTVRGSPVQLLGLSWTRAHENRDQAIAASVQKLLGERQADAFPILLAHHPHAFDAAAAAFMPLTLSGHTHGGQLMLNERCGFGPALFRYWSGLYSRGTSKLIVSNGVGNWFPLRINAPAEIIHLTIVRQ
jgi:predicted MPP superfamily phosphohydrolase